MFGEGEPEEDYSDDQHPAMKRFNRPVTMVKHVVGKTAKGAIIGALVGGAGALLLGLIGGGAVAAALGAIPVVGWILAPLIAPLTAAAGASLVGALGGATAGAILGAKIGAVISGLFSLGSMGEAADEESERLMAGYERREARMERMEAMAHRRDQQRLAMAQQAQAIGINPNSGLPHDRGMGSREFS